MKPGMRRDDKIILMLVSAVAVWLALGIWFLMWVWS